MVTQVLFDGGSTNHITLLSFLPKLVLVDGPVIVRPVVVVTVDEGGGPGSCDGSHCGCYWFDLSQLHVLVDVKAFVLGVPADLKKVWIDWFVNLIQSN